jgi:hypothetical protein
LGHVLTQKIRGLGYDIVMEATFTYVALKISSLTEQNNGTYY